MQPNRAQTSIEGRRRSSGQRGQIIPLMAGGLVAMLLLVGLVIDTGVAFKERRGAQNTADLAAMAGTRIIAEWYLDPASGLDGSSVYAAVDHSAIVNGCTNPCTWAAQYVAVHSDLTTSSLGDVVPTGDIPTGAQGVTVTTTRSPGTFFLRVVGQDHWDVAATATASTSKLSTPPPGILLPIAVIDYDWLVGQSYDLTAGSDELAGNFGWLSWNLPPRPPFSDPDLRDSVCHPDNPAFLFPQWFSGSDGAKNDATLRGCLDDYILNQTVVYLPVWKQTNGLNGANLQYEITGVAAFVLTSRSEPAVKTLTGRFVEFYSYPGVPAGFGSPPCSATTDPNCDERTNFIGLIQ